MSLKARSITLLVIAEILTMTLWFVSSAILPDLSAVYEVEGFVGAALASSVQAGFVVGALLGAISGVADRFDPRRVFALFAIIGAGANALLLTLPDPSVAITLRFITGFCMAGVYPVGMKIAVGWGTKDRGTLVGLLVGGLTLGSAAPHLLAYSGGSDWQFTLVLSSGLALIGALLILLTQTGPHHAVAARFKPSAILVAWTDIHLRRAFAGYLGHMWELYAMWAWIGTAAIASYSLQTSPDAATDLGKLTAFFAIAAGAVFCPIAGVLADKIGKARITIIAMTGSGLSALAAAFAFGGPVIVFFMVVIIWGITIIIDSAQFSALIADFASAEHAGSLMTLQTAIGFALTIVTVQLTPWIAGLWGWPTVFVILALGPLAGVFAMRPLTRVRSA